MSVLVYLDQADGHLKKSSFEAASYAAQLAKQMGTTADAIVLGTPPADLASAGKYGVKTVHTVADASLDQFDAGVAAAVIAEAAEKLQATVVVYSSNASGKALGPVVCAKMKAGLVSGAIALPETTDGFVVKKSVFSGKAFAYVNIKSDKKVIGINVNSFAIVETGESAIVSPLDINVPASKVKITGVEKVVGEVPLGEADIVVSGGRGLKGPENWHLVTDLAEVLGAATACSRPVADVDWRPHHEHVGQTGLAIAPNLYIAIGISGAIQHLAGVNRSKTIVVINKDPEAPFFKAADYGIVGDAFEVVPKITAAVKQLKGV